MQINIIGAGPIGAYTALLLSKKGYQVSLFEEHQEIGKPVQCTGIVTESFSKHLPIKREFLTNITRQFQFISPSNKLATVKKKEYVIDRTRLDNYLVNQAQNNGAQLHLGHRFIGQEGNHLIFKHQNQVKKIKKSITIGADGPLSKTARAFNFPNQNQFYYGFQARVRGIFDPKINQVSFGNQVAPGFFAWLVPENSDTARIGLATACPNKTYFQKFIQEYKDIISFQAGLIPIYNPEIKTQYQNTYLIGDAATQVKATTGGGLIPGLEAAKELVKAINQNQHYPQLWKTTVGKNLKKHLFVRKILNKFSDRDYDFLIKTVREKKVKKIIEKSDRENLGLNQFAQVLVHKPNLLLFARHLL